MTENNTNLPKIEGKFAAIDRIVVSNIPEIVEKDLNNYDYVSWGTNNKLPEYYYNLYKTTPNLGTVINSVVDYVIGDSINVVGKDIDAAVNERYETIEDIVKSLIRDIMIYGCGALDVVKSPTNEVKAVYHISMRNLRTDKKNEAFWYSSDWKKSFGRVKSKVYPKYSKEFNTEHSILFFKLGKDESYGLPMYIQALKACEIEKDLATYHLNSLSNGFAPSVIINFNSGTPDDESKEEIERMVSEKFVSPENAGRILLSFNDDMTKRTTFEKLPIEDFASKYDSLVKYAKDSIFTAFRMNPNLAGIATESNGFNSEEYESSFKLFNRTVIKPLQKMLKRGFAKIYENGINITPFSLEEEDTTREDVVK